ncbi:hypothetical protein C8R43DRAFT_942199 [Mycena crocata]|nr:hypothetical protein C8R43DRAFT_942199 [Mycena crocata]
MKRDAPIDNDEVPELVSAPTYDGEDGERDGGRSPSPDEEEEEEEEEENEQGTRLADREGNAYFVNENDYLPHLQKFPSDTLLRGEPHLPGMSYLMSLPNAPPPATESRDIEMSDLTQMSGPVYSTCKRHGWVVPNPPPDVDPDVYAALDSTCALHNHDGPYWSGWSSYDDPASEWLIHRRPCAAEGRCYAWGQGELTTFPLDPWGSGSGWGGTGNAFNEGDEPGDIRCPHGNLFKRPRAKL